MPDLGKYAVYVLSSYAVTLGLLAAIILASVWQGRRVRVGRFLRPELRAALAQELRRALRRAQAGLPPQEPQESELEPQR